MTILLASSFLRDVLKHGEAPAKTVKEQSIKAGIAWRTVRRAADDLHVIKRKGGMSDGWYWIAPKEWPEPYIKKEKATYIAQEKSLYKKPIRTISAENGVPCVYFLFDDDGKLIYIGQTINLKNRLIAHKEKDFKFFDFCKVTNQIERMLLEAKLISIFKPKFNRRFS